MASSVRCDLCGFEAGQHEVAWHGVSPRSIADGAKHCDLCPTCVDLIASAASRGYAISVNYRNGVYYDTLPPREQCMCGHAHSEHADTTHQWETHCLRCSCVRFCAR